MLSNESIKNQLLIVGIGASAGGLEALEKFFRNMPDNTGMAFVVIQHLDPNHIGIMPELLQRATPMKVLQVTDKLLVKSNHVYVIPPNKVLSLFKGELHLFDHDKRLGPRLPIDIFFRSLADEKQEKSIGIILSGMGSDGSLGLIAIKDKNGLALIQDPSTAKFEGMPLSASHNVDADIIASAEELPFRLIDLLKLTPLVKKEVTKDTRSGIDKIVILLHQQTGHDFSLYKKSTLLRRIERRKIVHHINKIQDYIRFLMGNPSEVEILFKELLIGVTNFFREPDVWRKLREEIFPELIDELEDGYTFRVWVPGCSTGEEAYSLAIIFKEAQEKTKKLKNIFMQIFATDIDRDAIEKARKGHFPSGISANVSSELLHRFFVPDGDGYRVNSSIREMIVFAEQSVIRDPPFTKLDMISCRNLLIYMEPELQKKLFALFYYSLKLGGILLLGSSESLGNHKDWYKEIDAKQKIYKRTMGFGSNDITYIPGSLYRYKNLYTEKKMPLKQVDNIKTLAEQFVLQHFTPATVLVNETGDILYITGHTGKYLEPVAGKANWNIYAMARDGLRNELPGAFRKAMEIQEPVVIQNLKVGSKDNFQMVDIKVQRIKNQDALHDLIIVAFTDVHTPVELHKSGLSEGKKGSSHLRDLEKELMKTYEDLQSTREEMQSSQEELRSTNEELQSTNEELQSTNEELTTSKEEMQSLNEELHTVNSELQKKINDLIDSNNDMKNLLNSTEIATLFLNKKLEIRRYTEPVKKIFSVRNTDIGRPFTDIVNNLHYQEIETDALKVLETLIPIETATTTNSGLWFGVRIMPYRTFDDRIDGLVIIFSDITIAKKLELELKEANMALKKNTS